MRTYKTKCYSIYSYYMNFRVCLTGEIELAKNIFINIKYMKNYIIIVHGIVTKESSYFFNLNLVIKLRVSAYDCHARNSHTQ